MSPPLSTIIRPGNRSLLFSDEVLEQFRAGDVPVTILEGSRLQTAPIKLAAAGPNDAHTIEELPTYLAGYKQSALVADVISPMWGVPNLTGIYRKMDLENVFRRVNVRAGLQDPVPEIGVGSSTAQFSCTVRFCGAFVDRISEANATAYSPLQQSGKRAANAIMLDRELAVWSLATTLGSWHASFRTTLGASAHWRTGTASAPIDDLRSAARASYGQGLHRIWVNPTGADAFFDHPQVREWYKFHAGDRGLAELARMRAIQGMDSHFTFDIPQIGTLCVAPGRVYNESTGALDYILQNDVVMEWGDNSVPTDGETLHTFKTARFNGLAGVGLETRRFQVPNRGPGGGEMIVVAIACIELVTGNQIGKLIKAAY